MYPRLKLAKNLLRDDGVIFISIDDSESDRLKAICNEIFGEDNFLVTMYVQVRYADKTLAERNDYQKLIEQIHVYQKREFAPNKESEDYTINKFCWRISEKGPSRKVVLGKRDVEIFPEGTYDIVQVEPHIEGLKETWATGTVLKANASGKFFGDFIAPRKNEDGLSTLYKVHGIGEDGLGYRYFTGPRRADATKGKFFSGVPLDRKLQLADGESKKYKPILNWYDFSGAFGNCRHEGGIDFGAGKKPMALLQRLLSMATASTESEVILDFFAGSGTTGHAVMAQNVADGGNRRYILVQLPEKVSNSTIAELTKERLRRAAAKIKADHPNWQGDAGFRVFKLDTSNIRAWNPRIDDLPQAILDYQNHLLEGRSEADLLYELLLKLGLDLCAPIKQHIIGGKTVHAVSGGVLMACLAPRIGRDDVEVLAQGIVDWNQALAPAGETICLFRDSAFIDDVVKSNLAAILEQHGLQNIRSL